MPSIVTHHYFAKDVKKNLSEDIQKQIDSSLKIYYVFAQSFDNLFYYNILSLKKGKQIRDLALTGHQKKTDSYFLNLIHFMKENHLKDNTEILCYLYGSITHYILDSTCHPFVVYHAGWPSLNPKYRGVHDYIEAHINAILYENREKKPFVKARLADIVLPKVTFSKELERAIDYTFQNTYNIENMGLIYLNSYHQGNFFVKHFAKDSTGLKKQCYKIFDFVVHDTLKKYQAFSFYIKNPDISVLNHEKSIWFNPYDETISSTDSFEELFDKAVKKACELIEKINLYLKNEISEQELIQILGDYSYSSGISYHKTNLPYKFKF